MRQYFALGLTNLQMFPQIEKCTSELFYLATMLLANGFSLKSRERLQGRMVFTVYISAENE